MAASKKKKTPTSRWHDGTTPIEELEPLEQLAHQIVTDYRDLTPSVERIMSAELDTDGRMTALTAFHTSLSCCSVQYAVGWRVTLVRSTRLKPYSMTTNTPKRILAVVALVFTFPSVEFIDILDVRCRDVGPPKLRARAQAAASCKEPLVAGDDDGLLYMVVITSNVLKQNAAVLHQSLGTYLHRLIEKRH